MKVVIQRVKNASVKIDGDVYSAINQGMLLLFCVEKGDDEEKLDWMVNKIISLRIFEDEELKMNRSLKDVNGQILVVSQFTLAADCKKGTRPSFDNAEKPDVAETLYEKFVEKLSLSGITVKTGVFGAMMDVNLCNDGPVTFVVVK